MFFSFNWVLGLDGGAIDVHGGSAALSCPSDRDRMDRIRAEADAVLVGAGTIRGENPSLGVSDPERQRARVAAGRPPQPRPVVLTASGELDARSRIFERTEARPMILTAARGEACARRFEPHADVVVTPDRSDPTDAVIEVLEQRGIDRLLIEGGPTVVRSFVTAGHVDEVHVTLSPRLGAQLPGGLTSNALDALLALQLVDMERAGDFLFLRYGRMAA